MKDEVQGRNVAMKSPIRCDTCGKMYSDHAPEGDAVCECAAQAVRAMKEAQLNERRKGEPPAIFSKREERNTPTPIADSSEAGTGGALQEALKPFLRIAEYLKRKGDGPGLVFWPQDKSVAPLLTQDFEKLAAALSAPVENAAWTKLQALWLALDGGPQPRCRDCADHDGNCPNDADLPCDPQERALEQIKRLHAKAAAPVGEPVAALNASIDRFALAQAKRIIEDNATPFATISGGYHRLDLPTAAYKALKEALYTHPPAPAVGAEEVARECWDNLIHKDDRTSPEEYPDHCLITFEELQGYIADALSGQGGGK